MESMMAQAVQETTVTPEEITAEIRSEVILLADMSPALRIAAVSFAVSQQQKITRLVNEVAALRQDIKQTTELADALESKHLTPNRVRSMRGRIRNHNRSIQQIGKAVEALENGFVPIPYLDNTKYGDWHVREVPYRILKAIKERGLEQLFDEIGIVEPQDGSGMWRKMTFRERETIGGQERTTETTVLGRRIGETVYVHNKDPMLVGRIKLPKGKDQWFMLTVWNDNLARFG